MLAIDPDVLSSQKKGGTVNMIQRSSIVIDAKKSNDFMKFLNSSAKGKNFWESVKKGASTKVDKKELDKLFEK